MTTPTDDEVKEIIRSSAQMFAERWRDECKYEDPEDYKKALSARISIDLPGARTNLKIRRGFKKFYVEVRYGGKTYAAVWK